MSPSAALPPRAAAAAAAALLLLFLRLPLAAEPWPGWRGPTHDGASAETSGWPAAWPPRPLWRACVGEGCTSPVLADGVLYTFGWSGQEPGRPRGTNPAGTDTVLALDARTGRELWRQTYPCPYQGRVRRGDLGQYGGPSATPALDTAGGRLFTLSTDGDLRAWSLRDGGRPLWHLNLYDAFRVPPRPHACGRNPNDYGFTSAPLLLNGQLLVEAGAPQDGLVVAFDPATGRRLWASETREPAGHSGGLVPLHAPTGPALAVLALTNLVVLRLDTGHTGATLARHERRTDFACNIPAPAAAGQRLLLTSGYNHKSTEALDLGPRGGLTPAWTNREAHAVVTTPVLRGGRAYVLGGTLACLDLATGQTLWRGGQFGHGTLLATADNKLIALGNGRLALVEAAPSTAAYTELARLDAVVPDTCYPHLALSDGILACKDRAGNLAVFALSSPPPPALH